MNNVFIAIIKEENLKINIWERLILKLMGVILKEDKNDKIVPVGRISITKEQLKRWRTINI